MPNKRQVGFTLIELLIVIAIIGILMTIILVSFSQAQKNARDAQRKSDLQAVASVLQRFYSDNSVYPSDNGSGLIRINATCTTTTSGTGQSWGTNGVTCNSRTYTKQLPTDPIGTNQYCYAMQSSNQSYHLYASLEGSGNLSPSVSCGGSGAVYNYRVTAQD